ncbi:hypothetical protein BACCAP_03319 [Pseudoflavonifractor capillosus ATCC 29799]|uniref:Uncharacterized protein n=1 Tax=Pseudoflavonifractor capillosus ATCC 29799 TaxID=411467 RepID=A6NYL8_9FIRM|nr:hypothetical protein BACCAP_03319 [Pseudoflavonifractor capillosus ATCC 29799]
MSSCAVWFGAKVVKKLWKVVLARNRLNIGFKLAQ